MKSEQRLEEKMQRQNKTKQNKTNKKKPNQELCLPLSSSFHGERKPAAVHVEGRETKKELKSRWYLLNAI